MGDIIGRICNRCGKIKSVKDLVRTDTGGYYCTDSCYGFVRLLRDFVAGREVRSPHGTSDS